MKKYRVLFLLLSLLFLLNGCSSTITGKVVVKGERSNTYVALKVERRLYYHIVGKLKRVLMAHYQGDTVTLSGRVVKKGRGLRTPAQFEATNISDVERRSR